MASAPATGKYGPHKVFDTPNCSEEIFEPKTVLLPYSPGFMGDFVPKSIARTLYFTETDPFSELAKIPIDFNQWESGNFHPLAVPAASVLDNMRPMSVKLPAAEDIPSPRAA